MNNLSTSERIEKATREVPLLTAEQKQGLLYVDSQPITRDRAVAVSELVGVLSGIKPAALMNKPSINVEDIESVGLKHIALGNRFYGVSRDDEINKYISEVYSADRTEDGYLTEDSNRSFGTLLGYPETAIDYFLARTSTVDSPDVLPIVKTRRLQGTVGEFLHLFILSPEHYEREIEEYIAPLEAAIKSLTPNTYLYMQEQALRDSELMQKQDVVYKKIGEQIRYVITPSRTPEEPDKSILLVD